jgi:hypothetical protein
VTRVRFIRARPTRFGGEPHSGWLPAGAPVPPPTPLTTVPIDFAIEGYGATGYVFSWRGPAREYSGEAWHMALEDALQDAESAFGIGRAEWRE